MTSYISSTTSLVYYNSVDLYNGCVTIREMTNVEILMTLDLEDLKERYLEMRYHDMDDQHLTYGGNFIRFTQSEFKTALSLKQFDMKIKKLLA